MNWIETSTGLTFNYDDLSRSQIRLNDVAFALSNICRFGGHCKFYSVAEHCCHAHDVVGNELKLAALLHDAAEAYIGDIPTPLKRMFPLLKQMELFILKTIAESIEMDVDDFYRKEVKWADKQMLILEAGILMPSGGKKWVGYEPLEIDIDIKCWTPEQARMEFMNRLMRSMP